MSKILIIDDCGQCGYYKEMTNCCCNRKTMAKNDNEFKNVEFHSGDYIPEWCPLDEADERSERLTQIGGYLD
jgi:hypothetical protein